MWGFTVRGSWRPNITKIFWPQTYGRHVVSFLFSWCSIGALGPTLLGAGFLYCNLSASSLVLLSLAHLVSTLLELPQPNSTGNSPRTRTQLSYIMVQRPLDLWNRMFDRHQAEITVMQFTGHSLPVHQSMSVPWEFFSSSHFISQFPPTWFPLLTAIGMCHFLPVHQLGMAFWARSKYNNLTK